MSRRRAGPPRLLIHDESPGLGGAITSLGALVPFLRGAGWSVEVAALQPEGWQAEGIAPHLLPRRGERVHGPSYYARELLRAADLGALALRLRPDLLLANNGPTANLATHLAGRALGLPVSQYLRGPFPPGALARRLLRASGAVFTVGKECERLASAVGWVEVVPVGEGLDPARWPRPRDPAARDWLWSSALVAWKGLPLLLGAYGLLGARAPRLHVCYAALPAGHPDAVAPPGQLPPGVELRRAPPDLDELRSRCLLYVHSALQPEPFGRALLEAMAAGLCPVAPAAGTPGRLVRHMDNGLVYTPGSVASLASILRIAAGAPDLCARLGARAAADARAHRADAAFGPVLTTLERLWSRSERGGVPIRHDPDPAKAAARWPAA